jgi:hypothetical protein
MQLKFMVLGGLAALGAPAALFAQGNANDPVTNWAAIAQCASIDEADARHECMDGVARRAGVLSEVRTVQAAREAFGREELAQAQRRTPAPRMAARAAAPARPADVQELVTTIASVRTVGYRKLRVTTAEGSVWDQAEAESFASEPRAGDPFRIVRGALGGYRCQFRQASRYQCDRVG